jgi:outer membrane protein assembly factor BamD
MLNTVRESRRVFVYNAPHLYRCLDWIMKLIKNIFIAALPLALLSSCSTTNDPAETYKGEAPQHIFQKGEDALRDRNYSEAVKRFEALEVQYPLEPFTKTAELHLIYAYYRSQDYVSAESAAERYIRSYPTSPHIDYAYYMYGLSNYYQNLGVFERIFAIDLATRDTTQIKKSFEEFSIIVQRYPNSPYAPAAHQYMIYLRNVLADHELQIAQYYYSRKAYVAAADRANDVVKHFQGATAVPDALVLMVKSYRALHLSEAESQAWQVLQYNYPNSKYVKDVSMPDR